MAKHKTLEIQDGNKVFVASVLKIATNYSGVVNLQPQNG